MTWTLEIYDPSTGMTYNITNRSLQINAKEQLDAESNTFSIRCKGIQDVHKFHQITIYEDDVKKFSGTILNQSDQDRGHKATDFHCVDWSYVFTHRHIADTYESTDDTEGKPDLILKDMFAQAVPEFTTNNMDSCPLQIEFLQFPYKLLMEATKTVMDYIPDWHWYVDADKDVHLFEHYESDGVTFGPDSSGDYNFSIKTLKVDYLGDRQVNRIWIIGAKQAQAEYIDQYFTGDGQQRFFSLAYEPNFTEIYVDGVLKSSSLEVNDDGAQDFLINKYQKVVYIPDNIGSPFSGEIKAHYRPTKQIIDYFENYPNIQTYGLYEKIVKNRDITDKLSARQFGKAEIKKRSTEKRIVQFETREEVSIGQRCPLNIVVDDWNVVGNFLVKSVGTRITSVDEVRSLELEEIL